MKRRALVIFLMLFIFMIALLVLSGCAEETETHNHSGMPDSSARATDKESVSIKDGKFEPAHLTVKMGATVTWTNNDSVSHSVEAEDGTFSSGKLKPGKSFSRKFNEQMDINYNCDSHQDQMGMIMVQ